MNERDDDPVLDWALRERFGAEQPPDLRAAVRARLAVAPTAAARPFHTLLVAALLLLGVGAVVGVALWSRPSTAPTPVPAQGPETAPVAVTDLASIQALPPDTRAVEAIGIGDAELVALTRLRDLEVLIVREPWNESFGLGLKTAPPEQPKHITAAAWQQFAKFSKLRRLELRGTVAVARFRTGHDIEDVGALERLPGLETLVLCNLDTSDEVLQQLVRCRSLRRLDLIRNHGFAEAGLQAILQMTSLRVLSLHGCQQLQGGWLAALHQLPELAELDLGAIDGINWAAPMADPVDAEAQRLRQTARGHADSLQAGVHDVTLDGLAKAPALRKLVIDGGRYTGVGLAALGGLTTLRDLSMCGGQVEDADFVARLPAELETLSVCGQYDDRLAVAIRARLTKLRSLCLAACYRITDAGIAELCAMPSLRELDLRQMRGLTAACLPALRGASQLRWLDLRHLDWLTPQHVARLQWLLDAELLSNFTPEVLATAADLRRFQIGMRKDREALRVLLRRAGEVPIDWVQAGGIDDESLTMIVAIPGLIRLDLLMPPPRQPVPPAIAPLIEKNLLEPITSAGFWALAKASSLRVLQLSNIEGIDPAAFTALGGLRLRDVRFTDMDVPWQAVEAVVRAGTLQRICFDGCRITDRRVFESLAMAVNLEDVELQRCPGLPAQWTTWLGGLPNLRRLVLDSNGTNSIDAGLAEAVGRASRLEELLLPSSAFTAAGLQHLRRLERLRRLDLRGANLAGGDLQWLPPNLTELEIGNLQQPYGAFGPVLAAAVPGLHTLRLNGSPRLTAAELISLRAVSSLRVLELSDDAGFTAADVAAFEQLPQIEDLTLRDWKCFDTAEWDRLRALPNLRWLRNERVDTRLR